MGLHRSPLCTVYDIDGNGRSEVIVEFWNDGQPMLYLLDGATGKIEASVKSSLFASERNFVGRQANHPVAKALILHLNGKDEPISIVLKYSDTDVPNLARSTKNYRQFSAIPLLRCQLLK